MTKRCHGSRVKREDVAYVFSHDSRVTHFPALLTIPNGYFYLIETATACETSYNYQTGWIHPDGDGHATGLAIPAPVPGAGPHDDGSQHDQPYLDVQPGAQRDARLDLSETGDPLRWPGMRECAWPPLFCDPLPGSCLNVSPVRSFRPRRTWPRKESWYEAACRRPPGLPSARHSAPTGPAPSGSRKSQAQTRRKADRDHRR
jgi:hypothetical protein